jgi:hypothetical protein
MWDHMVLASWKPRAIAGGAAERWRKDGLGAYEIDD